MLDEKEIVETIDVIVVDTNDQQTGLMEKMQAHEQGVLHRAFSVYIFDPTGTQILLQQRASSKYHCPLYRANTCCSHPFPGENTEKAAERRLYQEMGMGHIPLTHVDEFVYQTPVPPNLTEHEYLHVFVGITNQEPIINPEEVASRKWMSCEDFSLLIEKEHLVIAPWTIITRNHCRKKMQTFLATQQTTQHNI